MQTAGKYLRLHSVWTVTTPHFSQLSRLLRTSSYMNFFRIQCNFILYKYTNNNRRLESGFDLDPTLSLFVMSSAPAKRSAGDARCASQDRSIDPSTTSPIKSRLKSVLGTALPTSNAIKINTIIFCFCFLVFGLFFVFYFIFIYLFICLLFCILIIFFFVFRNVPGLIDGLRPLSQIS